MLENKQIIIDGVDVSGCEFLRNCIIPDNYGCKIDDSLCCDVGNCYYKQLKAKEQECEELKKKLKPKLKNAHCAYFEGQTGLCKAKEFSRCNPVGCRLYTIDELSTIVDLQSELDQLKAENEELKNFHINLVGVKECEIKELTKYKQALAEIKEIAYELTNEEYTDFIEGKQKQILQKIREVEDERI